MPPLPAAIRHQHAAEGLDHFDQQSDDMAGSVKLPPRFLQRRELTEEVFVNLTKQVPGIVDILEKPTLPIRSIRSPSFAC
jgi:hypothetical protein